MATPEKHIEALHRREDRDGRRAKLWREYCRADELVCLEMETEMVRAAMAEEREACARLADEVSERYTGGSTEPWMACEATAETIACLIRRRGQEAPCKPDRKPPKAP